MFIVFAQFLVNRLKIFPGVSLERRTIKHVYQQASTLYMAKEFMTEADALCCAFDQTRDIGKHKAKLIATSSLADSHTTEIGCEGGKGIVGNLRPSSSDYREQGRFACVRIANQPHISNHAQ